MRIRSTPDIVATLGPASWDLAPEIQRAGATAFRLNASHMTLVELEERAAALRAGLPDCPLIIDLQGTKMRLGLFVERPVLAGESVLFTLNGEPGTVPLPHGEIFVSAAKGEILSCDDDRLRFRVESAGQGRLRTLALTGGILRPRKGINVLEHPIDLYDLSESDLGRIKATSPLGRIAYAISFMKNGSEPEWVRRRAQNCGVIGKIERREAVENIHAIAQSVDALWICRGDLGAQIGPGALARWISSHDPRADQCPVLMAGQLLEHLTTHPEPTRSEVCHLYDLAARGYAGFVLSDETAIGADPVRAVTMLQSLLDSF